LKLRIIEFCSKDMFLKENVVIKYNNGGKETNKKPLIVVSICAVVLLVLASISNVVGYQTVQTSQQNLIKEKINQRELLFQTICNIANNKEIQRIILKSQISRGIFPVSDVSFLTKNQLRQMYFIGLILSKFLIKTRLQSMVQQYQLFNPEMQQEINAVIEMDAKLNEKITKLQNLKCDCDNEQTTFWHFPILCTILLYIGGSGLIMAYFGPFHILGIFIVVICSSLRTILDCY
jgi:hypothetical protein